MQHAKPGAALKAQGLTDAVLAFAQFSEKAARRSTRPAEAAPSNAALNGSSLPCASVDGPYTGMAAWPRQPSVDDLAVIAVGRPIARMLNPVVSPGERVSLAPVEEALRGGVMQINNVSTASSAPFPWSKSGRFEALGGWDCPYKRGQMRGAEAGLMLRQYP